LQVDTDTGLLDAASYRPSPNHDARPEGAVPELIVVHNISLPPGEFGGPGVEELFQNRLDPDESPFYREIRDLRVSAHLFIRRTGEIVQFVPFHARAWHAGQSRWDGRSGCNDFSIGIEVEGTDTAPYEPVQYERLAGVIRALRRAYPSIPAEGLTGHEHIAPDRKTDPGPAFDWQHLAALLGDGAGGLA